MYVMNRKFQEMIMVSQTRNMIKLRLRYQNENLSNCNPPNGKKPQIQTQKWRINPNQRPTLNPTNET